MTHQKTILVLIILCSSLLGFNQASVVISSNLDFKLSINKKVQNEEYLSELKIQNLKPAIRYAAEISFNDDTTKVLAILYIIDEGFTHHYVVDKKGLHLKKMLPELTYQTPDGLKTLNYIASGEEAIIAKIDTVKKDTTYKPAFESYYKLDNYNGKLGCPFPIKPNELADLKDAINRQTLEDSKLEIVKEKIQFMDSACVMVEQTLQLIYLFEYEETRLDFAKFMYGYTFDLNNYGKLDEAFKFENSLDELKEFRKEK